ncbi:IMP dehydrogenase [archaeon]|jgi:IMP dehydrogenase|nr:IMP dehydrogenase [archaeon]MBT4022013.1 IMP dehydrogenase [archaeon]MBT4273170.1 IMP dehydrogenase [archaeon]MBT4460875.1 IMP dehydrogenase [archaeon]MBT4858605.1 IMP dehydrogenase [archaeon]
MDLGLSYDDVLLVPKRSSIKSRKDVSTTSNLTKKIKIHVPIISANMDTVTESEMAISMAELGGVGIIHRFNTIEEQVDEVKKVKRYRNAIIENPLTVPIDLPITDLIHLGAKHKFSSFLVVDFNKKLVGIVTSRDVRFKQPGSLIVRDVMTPKDKLIVGMSSVSVNKAKKVMVNHKIEKLPIINDDWTVAGLITSKDIFKKALHPFSTLDSKERLMVGAAIGVKLTEIKRAKELIDAGVDFLVIDIAHGHSDHEIELLKKIKKEFPKIEVIAGNVCTPEGTRDLIKAGADCVKVGVGPGSTCVTRLVSGAGYPQISAIINCAKVADKLNVPIIADGGIKLSGDITKAIAAGASTVMLGSMLAGTEEAPGKTLIKNGKKIKIYRGMASFGAKLGKDSKNSVEDNISEYVPEGVEATVPYKGNVEEIIHQLVGGLRSGMSYVGAKNINEIRGKCEFVQITAGGLRESHPHDINTV